MRHKCKCECCGEMEYLHCVNLGTKDIPMIAWICNQCELRMTTITEIVLYDKIVK